METLVGVSVVCYADPRIQALDHVVARINELADYSVLWTLDRAVKARDERLVKRVLHRLHDFSELSDDEKRQQVRTAMMYAGAMGHLPFMQQLYESHLSSLCKAAAVCAALKGDLALLKWIHTTEPQLFLQVGSWAAQVAFDAASERGCLQTVQWLVETIPGAAWTLGPAALGGQLDMVKWLHDHANLDTAHLHVQLGPLDKLTWLLAMQFVEECSGEEIDVRAVAERIQEERAPRATDAMDWAALQGHLDILRWLDANRTEGFSAEAVNGAAESGHFQVLSWLNSHGSTQWTPQAMDRAARGGQFEIVKWLHEVRREGCTTAAMDYAAENGHLELVEWLNENRSEGCTTRAMDGAATNGHLDVVQWLHANRSEGCTTRAMDYAAQNGHLRVVKWLHENRSEGCSTNAVDLAAGYGHLNIIQFLYANRTEGGTAMAEVYAQDGQMFDILRWFEEQGIDLPIPGQEDD